jgi:predicted RNA-binding Zn-ribbon protein involved in translation (DUF1610 family)
MTGEGAVTAKFKHLTLDAAEDLVACLGWGKKLVIYCRAPWEDEAEPSYSAELETDEVEALPCPMCDQHFIQRVDANRQQQYCSPTCRQAAYRARQRGA